MFLTPGAALKPNERMNMSEYKEIPGPIEGYKIFNNDMTCLDFQFKIGMNELGNDDPLVLCENGFHFCKYPSGVWAYYDAGRVFKVRAYGVLDSPIEPGADCKMVCRKLEVLEEVVFGGNWNIGDGNTGDRNTGHRNTGDRNIGHRNTGNWNIGHRNTGHRNTGNWNTGKWNIGDRNSGYFCLGNAPIVFFGKEVVDEAGINWQLADRLGNELASDESFDPTPYLSLPNATKAYIKRLHKAHIEARKKAKA